ncbi:hypothetical protein B0I31_1265 [Saccharothrix carnea]|uniref:CD-NTase-associated protein 16 NUDIX domain-containing protein n=1 Tax=Saccharothrix carnea TaxID=1280637 RepID=A0A2P8HIB9_SACCR|nr:hypothetical protein [Saccharothrix carnea]PSL45974.1 hypothetical protein B0I31_1265 [Saccharothrix carnea]
MGSLVFRQGPGPGRARPGRAVRISYCALLRIRDDDRFVLFHTASRPGAYAPPGGVFKYFPPAVGLLEGLGFEAERSTSRGARTRADLRGVLPLRSFTGFRQWFASGAYREDARECLRRELTEELGEVGFPELGDRVREVALAHVRTVSEGPYPVPDEDYRQARLFEVHDLVVTDGASERLREALVALSTDPGVPTVVSATAGEIAHGRAGHALIAPHTAYLVGTRRTRADLPPVR